MNIELLEKDKVYYLASPYSHNTSEIKNLRYEAVDLVGAKLYEAGITIIEPIASCHHKSIKFDMPTGYEYWKKRDRTFVQMCTGGIIVLCLPGWMESVGVSDEVHYAKTLGYDVFYLTLADLQEHKLQVELEEIDFKYMTESR